MPKKVNIDENKTCTTKELAKLLGVTTRRVCQLADQGIVKRSDRNEFYEIQSVRQYADYLRSLDNPAVREYKNEKTKHTHIKTQLLQMDLDKMKEAVIPAKHVEILMNDMNAATRKIVKAFPAAVAPLILGRKNINEIEDVLQEQVNKTLIELSTWEPSPSALEQLEKLCSSEETQ